ncbi:ATP synthase subunit I [Nevskia soli]|uniref:ATP synthase subunit I n=1 Tax=Nevskia soli TaxID=418856 RepID=UPI00068E577F|nr:ATP synthase subunit I [Nevskia soli]
MRTQLRGAAIARAVCLVQLGILIVAAATTGAIWGRQQAIAALYGGLVAVIPTAYFAYRVFARRRTQDPGQMLGAFYLGEFGKLGLTAVMFWLGVGLFAKQFLALMVTYAACLLAYWLVLAWLGFDWTDETKEF